MVLQWSGHNYIGSEHLLLGLLREGEGVAARVLESLGADPNNIRTQAILFLRLSVHMFPYTDNILTFAFQFTFFKLHYIRHNK